MEYIRPLTPPSLLQRLHALWLDVCFVYVCFCRFVDDHFRDPCHPQPQCRTNTRSVGADAQPFYRLSEHEKEAYRQGKAAQRKRQQEEHSAGTGNAVASAASVRTDDATSPAAPASSAAAAASNGHASPSAPLPAPSALPQLRVLSQNMWGIPITPRLLSRVQELSKSLHLFDLVAFQELTHERELKWLQGYCAAIGLRHHHQFCSGVGFPIWHGVTAPSLVLFSRYPIMDVAFHRFSINGKMIKLSHSDYMGAKGVGLARVDVSEVVYPNLPPGACRPVVGVDVFLTHLHANYTNFFYDYRKWLPMLEAQEEEEEEQEQGANGLGTNGALPAGDCYHGTGTGTRNHTRGSTSLAALPIPELRDICDEYLAHRVLQSFELARFIAAHRRPDFLTLLCGDLNCPPYDLCTQIIQSITFGQFTGCVPRLVDAFSAVHPHSNGFTCGAKDNSFTFSTQPLHMERRAQPQSATHSVAPGEGTSGSGSGFDTDASSVDASAVGVARGELVTDSPAKQQRKQDAGSAPGSGNRGRAHASSSSVQRRRRFNSSPNDPALQPSDASLRASRSYGEHVLLLASTQVNADSDAANASCAAGGESGDGDGESDSSSHATGIADATASHARSPLAWVDDESPKRIDYIMTSAPLQRAQCRCKWDLMRLPYQTLDEDDESVAAAARSCECAHHTDRLAAPAALWKVVAASVFKHYILEADGRMSSVSDHHGVSVTLQLQFKEGDAAAAAAPSPPLKQHSSTVIISQHTPGATDAAAAASPASVEDIVSPRLSLRKRKLVRNGRDVGDEAELFALADSGSLAPAAAASASVDPSSSSSSALEAVPSDQRASSPDVAPRLPTSTLLLLASGVVWMGLRDATDRRAAHLLRMGRAFAVFAIGSRSLWLFLLNMYFESIMVELVLPRWIVDLPFPPALAVSFWLFFRLVDWAHTFLPIYIVVEYLLTTFPAKEEQSAMRETINEMNTLRRFARQRERRQASKDKRTA